MSPEPTALGFDTSGDHCAVALARGSRIISRRIAEMRRGHAERLFGFIAETLSEAGTEYRNLDVIGVGVGPGSFTGTRVAVAAARGLSLGLGIPAVGVTTHDALSFGAHEAVLASVGIRGDRYLLRPGPGSNILNLALDSGLPELKGFLGIVVGDDAGKIASTLGIRCGTPEFGIAEATALSALERLGQAGIRPAPVYANPPAAIPSGRRTPDAINPSF